MAGADKTSPRSQVDVKCDNRSGDSEPKPTSTNRQQPKSRVTKSMDRDNRQDTASVDHWFDRQLNQLYTDVISEPLPKEFVELIEKLREKTPK
jgi:Anti-sigma factor NepR/PKC-activated protein phosphatase-1 inhibitor